MPVIIMMWSNGKIVVWSGMIGRLIIILRGPVKKIEKRKIFDFFERFPHFQPKTIKLALYISSRSKKGGISDG